MRKLFVLCSIFTIGIQLLISYYYNPFIWSFVLTAPIILLGTYEMLQTKRTLMRNYPLLGRGRYIMEELRPKIYQYFIESDTDGTPINRINRSIVYQRAKKQLSTTPFGTQIDVYEPGYEWINHSMNPLKLDSVNPEKLRVKVGGKDCKKPYALSILNISAMSYGALSSNAIEALNKGAQVGNFAHNTGEGGISEFHKKHGGDLVWQIGTGYFGCRTKDGNIDFDSFEKRAQSDQIKMVEIKLSQGAKPGHGGLLPAKKNTKKIAEARQVEPGTVVASPSSHRAFSGHEGLLKFIKKLRDLSGGKPIGIKLCVGEPREFHALCEEMVKTGITPDFITVDGSEGGTGAAPPEFANSIGMNLKDGLVIVSDCLVTHGIKDQIKIIAAGKILTGFDIIRTIALGADACNSARGMMLSLGCIQALLCNTNKCPVGVATQDPSLATGLVVEDKFIRVANFHKYTLESVSEILAATGKDSTESLTRKDIWRRVSATSITNYCDLHPSPLANKEAV